VVVVVRGVAPGASLWRLICGARRTARGRCIGLRIPCMSRCARACARLRHAFVVQTVLRAFRASNSEHFRIVHYSVQENHVHLIIEAENAARLSSGVRGLLVRIARRVNPLLCRRGRFWADRFHAQPLTSPRQVRNALVYVLQNRKKHARGAHGARLDPLSSAPWFKGFSQLPRELRGVGSPNTAAPRTWLLTAGWQRHGRIDLRETPKETA
jgi:putative transposase